MKPPFRTFCALLAPVVAIGVPAGQSLLHVGLSAAEFSYQGDATLQVAGYAFAIWGVLYIGMLAYAVYQAAPSTPETPALTAFGWPSAIGIAGCGLWIGAAALNFAWPTVFIITLSAAALIVGMLRTPAATRGLPWWLIVLPLSLLAGWLTIASIVNVVTVLTMSSVITASTATASALIGIAVATLIAAAVSVKARNIPYLVPIIWGLVGAYLAESARNGVVGNAALAAAIILSIVLCGLVFVAHRKSP